MVMRWNDPYKIKSNKIVSMISMIHVGELVNTGKIHFQSKAEVKKPNVIFDYNLNIGGADSSAELLYPTTSKKKVETNSTGRLENYSMKLQFIMHFYFPKNSSNYTTRVSARTDSRTIDVSSTWCTKSKSWLW